MSTSPADPLIVFQPSGKRGRFARGTPVLTAARALGVPVESVCGGRGICGRCQVEVAEGDFAKLGISSRTDRLSAFSETEITYAARRPLAEGRRLSCMSRIEGDVVIDVPAGTIHTGQTVRKDANTNGLLRDPAIRLFYLEIGEPDLDSQLGDTDRILAALATDFDLDNARAPLAVLPNLQTALRKGDWSVTVAVDFDAPRPEIVGALPGYHDRLTGLAVDIGSTTIAAHLVDLTTGKILASSGRANPQIRFGEDLMSRVSYVMMNPDGREKLTSAVRAALNEMVAELHAQTSIFHETLLECVVVANPVMHHLFLGLDPTPLGQAPFPPAVSASVRCTAAELGLNLAPGARVTTLPLIAGHVGADAAAAILAEQPQRAEHPVLLVDVGTNAEIVLWDGRQLFAASSPTGPALEGAEISCGQRAAPGAIERIRIDRDTLSPRYKVIGSDLWSDDAGFAEATRATGVTGLCGSAIIELPGELLRAGIISPDGIIRGPANEAEAARLVANGRTWSYVIRAENPRLELTQTDLRAIQLAKAALYAGVKLLMDRAGLSEIGEIRLAGAFGTYLDPAYALLLGLVPDCPVDQVKAVGNAAGQGALKALLDRKARTEIAETVKQVVKIETALEPAFQTHFVAAMAIPNATDPFERTRAHFDLPALEKTDGTPKRRGRRRSD